MMFATHSSKYRVNYATCYRCGRIFSLDSYARCPDCRGPGQPIRGCQYRLSDDEIMNTGTAP